MQLLSDPREWPDEEGFDRRCPPHPDLPQILEVLGQSKLLDFHSNFATAGKTMGLRELFGKSISEMIRLKEEGV